MSANIYLTWTFPWVVHLLIRELLCRVPQDIPMASDTKSILVGGKSPKVDKPPSPSAKKSTPEILKPPSPEMPRVPLVLRVLPLLQFPLTQDVMLLMIHPGQIRSNAREHPHRTPNHMDLGLLVVVILAKVHRYLGLESNCDNICVSQSSCGTT
jgi:hypothetical protein